MDHDMKSECRHISHAIELLDTYDLPLATDMYEITGRIEITYQRVVNDI